MRGTLPRGGTVLGTTRIQPYMFDDGLERVPGHDGRAGASRRSSPWAARARCPAPGTSTATGCPSSACPRPSTTTSTATELTFGFDTAVQIATDAIDRLHTTAESHDRVIVVEVMGRHVGHIATWAGLAGGATMSLSPRSPSTSPRCATSLQAAATRGARYASIVVVAEGALPAARARCRCSPPEVDAYGHVRLGGIGARLAAEIEQRTGIETRVTTLGHVQRGGTPTAFDRVLSTRYGMAAIDAVHDGAFGQMVALQGGDIVLRPAGRGRTGQLKTVDPAAAGRRPPVLRLLRRPPALEPAVGSAASLTPSAAVAPGEVVVRVGWSSAWAACRWRSPSCRTAWPNSTKSSQETTSRSGAAAGADALRLAVDPDLDLGAGVSRLRRRSTCTTIWADRPG